MSYQDLILLIAACVSLGFIFGYFFRMIMALARKNSIELEMKKLSTKAEEKAQNILLQAEEKATDILESSRNQIREREIELKERQDTLEATKKSLEVKSKELEFEISHAKQKIGEIKHIKDDIEAKQQKTIEKLEQISSLTKTEAKAQIIQDIEKNESDTLMIQLRKLELHRQAELDGKAKEILTLAVQRLASRVDQELFTTQVKVEDPDIKGKIIGKEGRNIKVFERETGVEVLMDENPDYIILSSFDPIRRYIAKIALEELIADGRIQPAKIEKVVADTRLATQDLMRKKGEEAVYEIGIPNLDPRVVQILGRLHFRTSYGQNVLQHSIEAAHIAGMLASELGANVRISKTATLLHDIGKALDHEVAGTHVEIGRQVLQKFGVEETVIKAMQAHHEEYPYESLESRIVQTADALSGGRPGARNNSLDFYIKRLTDLENIALGIKGVEKAFALQAGREIRVFVNAETISDFQAKNIARNIAEQIENELKYPGEIKVAVIRELRVIETAR
jgi:ribonuclease Y